MTTNVVSDPDMPAWAIRLEGKVDLVVAQQTARLDNHESDIKDHENRVRAVEAKLPEDAKHRLREVEARKTVSPAQLWTAVVSGAGALSSITAVIAFVVTK